MTKLLLTKDIALQRAEYSKEIDEIAEQFRLLFLTEGTAQAFVYAEKLAEARTYLGSNMNPDPVGYFFLPKEAERLNISIEEAARMIIAKASDQNAKLAEIELFRLSAKANIRASISNLEILSVFTDFVGKVRAL